MLHVPTWKVELIPEAKNDFKAFDGRVRKLILKQLLKLEKDPRYVRISATRPELI